MTTSFFLRTRPPLAVFLFLLFASSGCGADGPPPAEAVARDSAGVLVQAFPAEVLERPSPLVLPDAPTVRIGVIEGAPEYQWTRPVAGVRLSDGGFAVLEQVPAEIRVFDPSGRFRHRVGTEGDGPGEFRAPVELAALGGDTLVVWDQRSRRLTWFTPEGEVARERTATQPGGIRTVRHVALSPAGGVVVLGATTTEEDPEREGRRRERWQVVPLHPEGRTGASLGTVPGTERVTHVQRSDAGEVMQVEVQGRWWWGEGFAWASGPGVWTADQPAPELRHFDLERGLDRIVRIEAPDRPFTGALIDSLHQVELEREPDPEIRELWRADFAEREYPARVPPVAGVFADAAGRVWLGLPELPPERLPSGEHVAIRRWVMFEPEAAGSEGSAEPLRALGVLTLPPRSHPLWADEEGVLLVRSDPEFDVAFIEWYAYRDR
jgi:hypothetical protein